MGWREAWRSVSGLKQLPPHTWGAAGEPDSICVAPKGQTVSYLGGLLQDFSKNRSALVLTGVPAQAPGPSAWAAVEITPRWVDTKFRGSVPRFSTNRKALGPSLRALAGRRLFAEGRIRAEGTSSPWRLFPLLQECLRHCPILPQTAHGLERGAAGTMWGDAE